jgi:hypothetical protein
MGAPPPRNPRHIPFPGIIVYPTTVDTVPLSSFEALTGEFAGLVPKLLWKEDLSERITEGLAAELRGVSHLQVCSECCAPLQPAFAIHSQLRSITVSEQLLTLELGLRFSQGQTVVKRQRCRVSEELTAASEVLPLLRVSALSARLMKVFYGVEGLASAADDDIQCFVDG